MTIRLKFIAENRESQDVLSTGVVVFMVDQGDEKLKPRLFRDILLFLTLTFRNRMINYIKPNNLHFFYSIYIQTCCIYVIKIIRTVERSFTKQNC